MILPSRLPATGDKAAIYAMATQYLEPGQHPEGVVLQHTLYGRPDESVTNAWNAPSTMGTVQVAPEGSGVPYIGDEAANAPTTTETVNGKIVLARSPEREKRCLAKDDTCMGWRISDSDFCAAHAGKLYDRWERARQEAEADPS